MVGPASEQVVALGQAQQARRATGASGGLLPADVSGPACRGARLAGHYGSGEARSGASERCDLCESGWHHGGAPAQDPLHLPCAGADDEKPFRPQALARIARSWEAVLVLAGSYTMGSIWTNLPIRQAGRASVTSSALNPRTCSSAASDAWWPGKGNVFSYRRWPGWRRAIRICGD